MAPSADHQPARRREAGFTLVEITVAISLLLIGVLGVTTMVAYSNKTTVTSNSRQGATTLVRRVIESSRALSFRSLQNATLASAIQTQSPDLATTSGGGVWTVNRDGYVYTLTANVCRVDDDSDGYGVHDAADPAFCSDSTTTGTADDKAGDYKRVTVTASWSSNGATKSLKQVTVVPPGGTGDAPAVTDVHPTNPAGTAGQPLLVSTQPSPSQITFTATATNTPSYMSWLIDGTPNQTCPPTITACTGSGSTWGFTWALGTPTIDNTAGSVNQGKCITPTTSTFVFDGTYQVGAQPLDANGLAGIAASTPVTINRCAPIPPPNFNATGRDRNLTDSPIDIEWNDNPEGDLVGYRVVRGTSTTNFQAVCPPNLSDPPVEDMHSCIDPSPPTYNKNNAYYYGVYAYDQDTSGAVRQGALSYIEINTDQNKAPKPPTNLTATASGSDVTVTWKIPGSPLDPDTGDTIDSWRIYRRLPASPPGTPWDYTDRLDYDGVLAYCGGTNASGTICSYTDTNTGGVVHEYTVRSVDTHLRESNVPGGAPPSA